MSVQAMVINVDENFAPIVSLLCGILSCFSDNQIVRHTCVVNHVVNQKDPKIGLAPFLLMNSSESKVSFITASADDSK